MLLLCLFADVVRFSIIDNKQGMEHQRKTYSGMRHFRKDSHWATKIVS